LTSRFCTSTSAATFSSHAWAASCWAMPRAVHAAFSSLRSLSTSRLAPEYKFVTLRYASFNLKYSSWSNDASLEDYLGSNGTSWSDDASLEDYLGLDGISDGMW